MGIELTDTEVTILVGFGSAIVGAIASFFGLVFIENRRLARARTGMLRALQAELQQNLGAAYVIHGGGGLVMDFSGDTWRMVQVDIAQFLDHRLFEDIASLYLAVPVLEGLVDGSLTDALDHGGKEVVEKWLHSMSEVKRGLLDTPQLRKFKASFEADWKRTADLIIAQQKEKQS